MILLDACQNCYVALIMLAAYQQHKTGAAML